MKKKKPFMAVGSLMIGIAIIISILASSIQSSIPKDELTGTPAGWTDDINLTNNSLSDMKVNIAVDGKSVHLAWRRVSGTGEIFHMNSDDEGKTWNTPVQISNSGVLADNSDIGIEGNFVHIVWEDWKTPDWEIFYRNSTDGGETWNAEKRISINDGVSSEGPKVFVNNSNVHISWMDLRGGADGEIYYRRSLDDGSTFDNGQGLDADRRITFSPAAISGPYMAGDGSNISVTWADLRNGVWEVYWMISKDNGFTWEDGLGNVGSDRRLTTTGADVSAIAMSGSNIHIVYIDPAPGPVYSLYYINSSDCGATWSAPQLLTGPNLYSDRPDISVYKNYIHIVWYDRRDDGTTSEIYYKNSTNNGISWSSDTRLTYNESYDSQWPRIGLNNSTVHIAWYDGRDSNYEIYYKRFPEILPDIKPPEINYTPVPSVNICHTINITAYITDDVSVDTVYLNYTGVNATNYNVSMNQWNGNWSYDISGQDNIGSLDYFIWANDTSGNANQTTTYQIQINDVTDPEINHLPIASANVFNSINITANITDDISVNFVFLNYTGINGTNYNVSMNKWDGNYSYEMPGQANTGFVDYFIWANDTSDNDNMTLISQIQIYDVTKPQINHVPVVSKNIGEIVNITANITDDVAVNKVFLNYTDVHGVDQNITMNKWNGNYSLDIPGQSNSGFVDYFIWCNDSSDIDNMTQTYQIQIFDITDPDINHVPIISANVSEAINITANVTDDVSVNFVFLNYTGVNGTNYNVSMQKWNDNYSYEIPDQNIIGNVQYFIWANDSDGNDNRTIEYSIQINDVIKPEINHVPVISANIGETINITANVTDDVSVDAVYLNCTGVNGTHYNVSMNKWGSNWSYELAGQNNLGLVSYFIWANDTSGNSNKTATYQVQIIDIMKPEIEHVPVTYANISEAINITVKITDDVEVNSVYLNYTDIIGVNNNVSMTLANGTWSYIIPGQASAGGIEYFIWCNDTSGNSNQTGIYQIQINETIIPDTTPPTIISKSPTSINVSITATITISFDEQMNISSVQNAITISPTIQISGYSWNADNTTLTIIPSGNLSYNTTYNITLGIGAKDIAGNGLENPYSWEFSTKLQTITNGPDDGDIGEWWWIILIFIIVTALALIAMKRRKKKEEPEEEPEEPEVPIERRE